jgi:predicted phage-related endonuclease
MKGFIIDFLLAETEEETEITMKKMKQLMDSSSPEIKEVLNAIISAKLKLMSKEVNRAIAEADNFIATLEFTIDLNEWITMKEYTKRFQLSSTNVVSNWIKRGLVSHSNIRTLPMLNNLKLIKAVKYL